MPLTIAAPEGSVVNARPPHAVVAGNVETSQRVADTVLAALAIDAPWYDEPANNKVLSQVIYLAVAAMGLNLLTGFNGQVAARARDRPSTSVGRRLATACAVASATP